MNSHRNKKMTARINPNAKNGHRTQGSTFILDESIKQRKRAIKQRKRNEAASAFYCLFLFLAMLGIAGGVEMGTISLGNGSIYFGLVILAAIPGVIIHARKN